MTTVDCLLFLAFGIAYNLIVAYVERKWPGWTGLEVVVGVLVVLLLSSAFGAMTWQELPSVILRFGFAGMPMVLGSVSRHMSHD
jgi:hypothetical protein